MHVHVAWPTGWGQRARGCSGSIPGLLLEVAVLRSQMRVWERKTPQKIKTAEERDDLVLSRC